MTPTERIAGDIAGTDVETARRELECQCFSPAEVSEIITGCRLITADTLTTDVEEIKKQIISTIECSIRIGDRLPDEVNW